MKQDYELVIRTRGQKEKEKKDAEKRPRENPRDIIPAAKPVPYKEVIVEFAEETKPVETKKRRPTKRNLSYQFPTPVNSPTLRGEYIDANAMDEEAPASLIPSPTSAFSPLTDESQFDLRHIFGTPGQQQMGRRNVTVESPSVWNISPSAFSSAANSPMWKTPARVPTTDVLIKTIEHLQNYLERILASNDFDPAELLAEATTAKENVEAESTKIHGSHTTLKGYYDRFVEHATTFIGMIKPLVEQNKTVEIELVEQFVSDIAPRQTVKATL